MNPVRHLHEARIVVFDLDGTLADTATLTAGHRWPADVLDLNPMFDPIAGERAWALGRMPNLPGRVLATGRRAVVMTRSPLPYAATLLGLLNVDPIPLAWSAARNRERLLRQAGELLPTVFVGDTEADRSTARAAGVRFVHVAELVEHLGPPEIPDEGLPPRDAADDIETVVGALLGGNWPYRPELQRRLAELVTTDHRYCLIRKQGFDDGTFWRALSVAPGLFTREEIDAQPEVYNSFLRRLLPRHSRTVSRLPHHWIVPFNSGHHEYDPLGRDIADIKDYTWPRGSGASPKLLGLRLVADVVGAHLAEMGVAAIEPLPAHPFSRQRPGQASLWLSTWAADRAAVAIEPPIDADRWSRHDTPAFDAELPAVSPHGPMLIDDQMTKGGTARKRAALRTRAVSGLFTWSSSHVGSTGHPPLRNEHRECRWPPPRQCPIHAPESRPAPSVSPTVAGLLASRRSGTAPPGVSASRQAADTQPPAVMPMDAVSGAEEQVAGRVHLVVPACDPHADLGLIPGSPGAASFRPLTSESLGKLTIHADPPEPDWDIEEWTAYAARTSLEGIRPVMEVSASLVAVTGLDGRSVWWCESVTRL